MGTPVTDADIAPYHLIQDFDNSRLNQLGYKQELSRSLSYVSHFLSPPSLLLLLLLLLSGNSEICVFFFPYEARCIILLIIESVEMSVFVFLFESVHLFSVKFILIGRNGLKKMETLMQLWTGNKPVRERSDYRAAPIEDIFEFWSHKIRIIFSFSVFWLESKFHSIYGFFAFKIQFFLIFSL